jgi:ATP-binding cassette subfamily B protein
MNIAAGDVNNARTIFGFSLVTIADIIFLTLFGSVTLFLLHPQMALSSFTIYIFILPILKKISTKQGAAYLRAQHKLSVVSETLAQYLRNIRQEKLFSSSSYWQNLLKKDTLAYQKEREQALHWEITYVPVSGLAPWIAYVSFLSWGLYSYWQNQITLGTFVAFQSLLFIMQDPLLEIGTCLSETQRAWTSLKRYLHTINTEPDPIYALENSAFKTNQNISQTEESLFSVRNVLLPTHTTINLEIKNGEKIGIQGGVGTGKTRLLNFIAGLDRQYQGEIYFLHTEIRQIPHSFLRKHIQLVPQKPFLFSQTLMENLSMGQDVSLENIFQVLNICCLDEDFKNWETQLNVPLLEWGQNLSGGQRQRLTLARALLQKAEVYLFDDCMSAVDPTTELKILKRIESYISSSTVLWTAHRLSTLKLCNRVINWSASTHEISK